MVSHGIPDDGSAQLSTIERQQNALRRLDDGHAALLDALAGLGEAEAFLGSRWSVWEVMQHLLTENFVEALEQIASGEREMLPPSTLGLTASPRTSPAWRPTTEDFALSSPACPNRN